MNWNFTPKGKIRLHLHGPQAAVRVARKLCQYKLRRVHGLLVSSAAEEDAAQKQSDEFQAGIKGCSSQAMKPSLLESLDPDLRAHCPPGKFGGMLYDLEAHKRLRVPHFRSYRGSTH